MNYTDRALAFLAAQGTRTTQVDTARERSERGAGRPDGDVPIASAPVPHLGTSTVGAEAERNRSTTGGSPESELEVRAVLVATRGELEAVLPTLQSATTIGFDIETAGRRSQDEALDPHAGRIRLIQLATRGATYVVDCDRLDPGPLAAIFSQGPTLVGHNLKFDLGFLLAAGLPIPDSDRLFDTMIASQLLHAGTDGRHSLAAVAERELGWAPDKTSQASDWSGSLTEEQLVYAARDAAVVLPLAERLQDKLRRDGLSDVMALEMAALPAIAWMERSGAPIDRERWRKLAEQARAESDEALTIVEDLAPGLNSNSGPQVKERLASLGIVVPNVQEATLRAVASSHPLVASLIAHREAAKRVTTYGLTFLDHVHPATGRIHAEYRQVGAATGRMSCARPNMQNVPRMPAYRACIRPGPGRVLVKADLSLVELCVAAELSGDERMMEAIAERRDLHRLTAAALFSKDPDAITTAERAFGKAVNFGTLYGQGKKGLIALARDHCLDLSETDAGRFQRRFAEAWPQLAAWQRRQMAGTSAVTRTASGRLRRLGPHDGGPVRANTPIQGTAADGFKAALGRLWATRHSLPSAVPVMAVHDELVVECDAADAVNVAAWVADCLQQGMRRVLHCVPVRVETTVGASWAGEPPCDEAPG